jgi:MATE family multidrug resistance protein
MDTPNSANERSQLLRNADGLLPDEEPIHLWPEVCQLFSKTLPICLSFALQNIVQASSCLLAGTLGSFELEVTSYGFMFASCTGTMVAIGGATALDILCGQSITSLGLHDHPAVLGRYLQQSLLVLSVIFIIFIAPMWVFSAKLFMMMGQEQEFALATGAFMNMMIGAGLIQVIAECFKKFLQIHGESYAVGWIAAATAAFGILISYILIRYSHLGVLATPMAFTVYQLANLVLLVLMMSCKASVRQSIYWSTKGLMRGSYTVLKYAVSGILTVATEWWR